ncbi:uncharacterized protein LOC131622872 [Vicia villosa]|uniref:uncharacterized protein LOC131622872 n=1 Tax=Vicia villosa TaxID=3911 RepID=UPI00273CE506|nr:uncharacterized protein LOC131622872 [Vicia villosa]
MGFAFFVDIEYEKVPEFCSFFSCIGHSIHSCKRKGIGNSKEMDRKKNKTDLEKEKKKVIEVDTQCGKEPENNEAGKSNKEGVSNSNKSDEVVILQPVAKAIDDIMVNFVTGPAIDEEGTSESEYIDATQMVDLVPETQIAEAHKKKITDFLQQSWDNMAEEDREADDGVDLFPEKDFQLVTSKKMKNKKSFSIGKTRPVSGKSNLTLWIAYIGILEVWLARLDLKPFAFNNRINNLPNLWCFYEYRGNNSPSKTPITDFFNWSDTNHFIHLPTLGNLFTWCNCRRGRHRTEKRLDRVICNMELIDVCRFAVCNTLPKIKSDHYPILYSINFDDIPFKSQFKFHSMWTKNEDCIKIVEDAWKVKVYGCPMFVLDKKLKILKARLKDWNRNSFGNVHKNVAMAEKDLKDVQTNIALQGYTDSLQDLETKAQHAMESALNMEEDFWKEKSKINRTLHGDRNTKFYHTYAKIRRKTNLISSLVINDTVVTDQAVLENHIEHHFKSLFNNNHIMQDNVLINANIPSMISDNTNALLTLLPSAEEIHGAVLNLNANSAPGPDRFRGIFFHTYWNIIKIDVINVVTHFFSQGWILPNYNANTLVLIPKIKEASYWLPFFHPLFLKNKKGFVSGRNIRDGIYLTSEAINILPNKSFSGNVALKIDIAKAFDTLNWDFLIETLRCFGFNSVFCNRISSILNSATVSIGFNGNQVGYFKCTNGVRQGDPLSPLLFCIAEDVLSRAISNLVITNQLNLIKANRHCFVPSHTLFADDIMIFCRGDSKSLNAIANLLRDCGNTSGQYCNFSKSLIYAGGMTINKHCSLANIIGFTVANPPFTHLGVPIFVGKPKACYFQKIADNIRIKMAAWKAKLLSMAGRVQLVRAVVFSMMVHFLSVYSWPGSIIKRLEGWIRNFIWSGSIDNKKLVTVAWKSCCKKINEGGLGIISLKAYNTASNMNLCWKFLNNTQSWCTLLKARVKRNGRVIKYSIKSSIWIGIKDVHQTVLDNCSWIIGNGNFVNFWMDNWLGESLVSKYKIPDRFHRTLTSKVCDWWSNNSWNVSNNTHVALPDLRNLIACISIPDMDVPDALVWKKSTNGMLSIKEAYKEIIKPCPSAVWSNFPWDIDSPPSHSMLVWRLMHNKVPTDDNLQLRGFSFPSVCSLCLSSTESSKHLFFDCSYVRHIWNWLDSIMLLSFSINGIEDCKRALHHSWSAQVKAVVNACIVGIIYNIWNARNMARFDDVHTHWKTVISQLAGMIKVIGNNTKRCSNTDITSFSLLKRLDIKINPRTDRSLVSVVWSPPSRGWLKCNVDGVASEPLGIRRVAGFFGITMRGMFLALVLLWAVNLQKLLNSWQPSWLWKKPKL